MRSNRNSAQSGALSPANSHLSENSVSKTEEKLIKICLHLTSAARQAFENKEYLIAEQNAKECGNLFEDWLAKNKTVSYPINPPEEATGTIDDPKPEEIKQMRERIILNSTAECFFIQGSSLLEL